MPKDTKNEKIIESMNATPIIDTNVNINIPRSAIAFDETKHKYKCSCCGKVLQSNREIFRKPMMFYIRQMVDIYLGVKNVPIDM